MGGFFVIWSGWEDGGGNSHESLSVEWFTDQQEPPHEADLRVRVAGPFETSEEGRFWIRCCEGGMTDEEIVAAMNDWKPDLPHGAVRSDE
jgi:hypothetical protein